METLNGGKAELNAKRLFSFLFCFIFPKEAFSSLPNGSAVLQIQVHLAELVPVEGSPLEISKVAFV